MAKPSELKTQHHVCRRARPEDIARTRCLWESDRRLYEPKVWNRFPELLEELVKRNLISLAIVESLPSQIPRMLGGISFVRPESVIEARASSCSFPNFMMAAALQGKNPFLGPKELAEHNARGTVNLMKFLGCFNLAGLPKRNRRIST